LAPPALAAPPPARAAPARPPPPARAAASRGRACRRAAAAPRRRRRARAAVRSRRRSPACSAPRGELLGLGGGAARPRLPRPLARVLELHPAHAALDVEQLAGRDAELAQAEPDEQLRVERVAGHVAADRERALLPGRRVDDAGDETQHRGVQRLVI